MQAICLLNTADKRFKQKTAFVRSRLWFLWFNSFSDILLKVQYSFHVNVVRYTRPTAIHTRSLRAGSARWVSDKNLTKTPPSPANHTTPTYSFLFDKNLIKTPPSPANHTTPTYSFLFAFKQNKSYNNPTNMLKWEWYKWDSRWRTLWRFLLSTNHTFLCEEHISQKKYLLWTLLL